MKSLALLLALSISTFAGEKPYLSIQKELKQSIARGNAWLVAQQDEKGYWDDGGLPAFTALALTALARDPNLDLSKKLPEHMRKGYDWLVAQQKEDGGIYNRGLTTYNTATSVTALVAPGLSEYEPAIVKARRHLINNQWDIGEKGKTDDQNVA